MTPLLAIMHFGIISVNLDEDKQKHRLYIFPHALVLETEGLQTTQRKLDQLDMFFEGLGIGQARSWSCAGGGGGWGDQDPSWVACENGLKWEAQVQVFARDMRSAYRHVTAADLMSKVEDEAICLFPFFSNE
jgi:hypothetical protein